MTAIAPEEAVRRARRVAARRFGVAQRELQFGGNRKSSKKIEEACRCAVYLAVIAYDLTLRPVAEVTGVSHVRVFKALRQVEDRRDDPVFDAFVTELEMELKTC